MTVKKKLKSHPGVIDYFKEVPFYNKHTEKPKIKCLKNIDLFSELPFHEEPNVIKTNHVFRGNAMSYKVKLAEKKDPLTPLEAIKSSIKDLLSDLLNQTKGFKYQITLNVIFNKMQAKWRNWVCSSLFQFGNKINKKSRIWFWKIFSRNFVQN